MNFLVHPIHPSLTLEVIQDAVERQMTSLEDPGFCIQCGADASGVEPDVRNYTCTDCGKNGVFGAEELLIEVS